MRYDMIFPVMYTMRNDQIRVISVSITLNIFFVCAEYSKPSLLAI